MGTTTIAESNRLPCSRCGNSVLATTIAATDGLCMPCFKADEQNHLQAKQAAIGKDLMFSVPLLFQAGRQAWWRDSILRIGSVIADAFQESGLAVPDLPSRYASDPEGFHIVLTDLTEEGRAFASMALPAWQRSVSRWKADRNPSKDRYGASLLARIATFRSAAKGHEPQ